MLQWNPTLKVEKSVVTPHGDWFIFLNPYHPGMPDFLNPDMFRGLESQEQKRKGSTFIYNSVKVEPL